MKGDTVVRVRGGRYRRTIALAVALVFMVIHPFSKAVTVIGTAYAAEPAQAPASPAGSSTGELLTATELMIEKLVLQINQQDETSSDRKATRENSGKTFIAKLPDMRPVTGFITSSFGMREHPMYKRILFHAGTDFSAPIGTKVMATAEGTVAFSGFDRGYGKTVIINHAHGYQTVYAHLSKTLIRQGQRVNRGEVIAFSGNTGVSTGPHLHYEVHKDNVQVNPTGYFPADMSQDNRVTLQESTLAEEHSHS